MTVPPEDEEPQPLHTAHALTGASLLLQGIGGSAGLVQGPAYVLDPDRLGIQRRRIRAEQFQEEWQRFEQAITVARGDLRSITERVRSEHGAEGLEASILDAYLLMVDDPTLRSRVQSNIREKLYCAEWAVEQAIAALCQQLQSSPHPYLAERSHDLEFVRDRLLRALLGREKSLVLPPGEPVVLVARDLSPAETATLDRTQVLALVTEVGSRTSHTAILSRALGIPAVVGTQGLLSHVASGDHLIVDGVRGRVVLSPSSAQLEEFLPELARFEALSRARQELRGEPASLRSGETIELHANIELAHEAELAVSQGAEGIGLYRTEFLYLGRSQPPDEEEQYRAYKQVVEALAPRPVVLRTFDIGGDKFMSSLTLPPELNPALGLRAIRLGLQRPQLLKTQLRAMIRAAEQGSVKILFPLVSTIAEFRSVRQLYEEAHQELMDEGLLSAPRSIPLGCMVEVPSCALLADRFAAEADFLSIGTNDLVQYVLAVDRSSRDLARLGSYFDPAVLQLIRRVIEAGKGASCPISVCGAMASDPLAALLLVGLGLRSLSMEASAISEIKAALARVSLQEAESAAIRALQAETSQQLEQVLAEELAPFLLDILIPN